MFQYVVMGIQYDDDPMVNEAQTFDVAVERVCDLIDYVQQYWEGEVTGHINEVEATDANTNKE